MNCIETCEAVLLGRPEIMIEVGDLAMLSAFLHVYTSSQW